MFANSSVWVRATAKSSATSSSSASTLIVRRVVDLQAVATDQQILLVRAELGQVTQLAADTIQRQRDAALIGRQIRNIGQRRDRRAVGDGNGHGVRALQADVVDDEQLNQIFAVRQAGLQRRGGAFAE